MHTIKEGSVIGKQTRGHFCLEAICTGGRYDWYSVASHLSRISGQTVPQTRSRNSKASVMECVVLHGSVSVLSVYKQMR